MASRRRIRAEKDSASQSQGNTSASISDISSLQTALVGALTSVFSKVSHEQAEARVGANSSSEDEDFDMSQKAKKPARLPIKERYFYGAPFVSKFFLKNYGSGTNQMGGFVGGATFLQMADFWTWRILQCSLILYLSFRS